MLSNLFNHKPITLYAVLRTSFYLMIVAGVLALPGAAVKSGTPTNGSEQPLSINPDWKHLGFTWRASVASDGTEGNSYTGEETALTPDGRYVVFFARSYNLVPDDEMTGPEDAFLHDNQTGVTERISISSSGVAGNSDTYFGIDISADARYVVFCTGSSNLVAGDTNGKWDIFLRDRQTSTTRRISVSSTGAQSNGNSWQPRISDDGAVVVYTSEATNLVSGDTNNKWDIFTYNMTNGQTGRVSISSTGAQGNGDSGDNKAPAISADGRFVAFSSESTNLVLNDTNTFCDNNWDGVYNENCPDVFVRDRQNSTTERVSLNNGGEQGNNLSMLPAISGDGRYVAFFSLASNLVTGDTNTCTSLYYYSGPCPDVFVRDRQTNTIERVNVSSSGVQSTVDPITYFKPPAISSDGNIVVFGSADTKLAPGATNGYPQVLAHDRTTHETSLVSANTFGTQGDFNSYCMCDTSADGRYVSFQSLGGNLVLYDANSLTDIFVRDRTGWTYALAGTVRNQSGNPLVNITVGYGNKIGQNKVTDNNGEYELYYLPPGIYSIKAWALGYLSNPFEIQVSVPPTTVGVDFVMRPATKVLYLPIGKR